MLPVMIFLNVAVLASVVLVFHELRRWRRRPAGNDPSAPPVNQAQELLTTFPDPLITLDRAGNPTGDELTPQTAQACSMLQQLNSADYAVFKAALAASIDTQQRRQQTFLIGGSAFLADIWPLPQNAQQPARAAVCLRNLDDQQRRAADQATKLAARNRAILRSAMDGFFVVDEQYRFLDVNDAFCRMLGYTAAELLQMKITDLEVPEPARPAPDSSPLRTGLHQFATAHRHKDGHIVQLETSVFVLRDGNQKILVGFARDVTERRRAEEALERLSRQNQLILDSAAEGICGVDTQGRFTFANPAAARMLGWEVSDLIGMSAHSLVREGRRQAQTGPPDDCCMCRAINEESEQLATEGTFRRRDGTSFPVECVSSPIREHSRLTGAVVIFRDISERRRAEEERRQLESRMQQAQKLESLGMLAGGLAHDFNNLLLTIVCNASLAAEQLAPGSATRTHLEKIVKAGRRASELTRQMLAYAGQTSCDTHPLQLNQLIDELADLVRAGLPKTVTLDLRLEPSLPMIEGDSAQLQQVVMNLLINAAEALGTQAGTVTAETSVRTLEPEDLGPAYLGHPLRPGRYVCLEVRDTGCGMTPETMARIFDPFFSTKAAGRGLGLSALLGIVRAHRGAVHVQSAVGRGTTFRVLLPPAMRRAPTQRPSPETASLPPGATVLVIDDEEEIRDVVQAVLESRGARVLTAGDGSQGLECFRKHADEVDVVLLDMTMPGLSGDAVFREILSIRPDARVLMSSGYSEQATRAQVDNRRVAGFVPKPYTAQALVEQIRAALP